MKFFGVLHCVQDDCNGNGNYNYNGKGKGNYNDNYNGKSRSSACLPQRATALVGDPVRRRDDN